MSTRYVNVDRKTPMLLAPDLRDWVAEDDVAHYLVEALELVDLSAAKLNVRGTGSAQYPPGMMLAVLVYCYAHGMFSSREIERATWRHVSVRYLAANTHPDHDTIATFRRENGALLKAVFVQLLQLAKRSGLLRLGVIAIDGTKLKAAAAKRRTLCHEQIEKELAELEVQVKALLAQAETADAQPAPSDELPRELVDAQQRRARLLAAQGELAAQVRERYEQREAQRAQAAAAGEQGMRRVSPEPQANDRLNLSDQDSTLTPTAQGGFIQGFNAQIALSVAARAAGDGEGAPVSLIVAGEVVRATSDLGQLEPMTEAVVANLGQAPSVVLADTGYDHTRQIRAVEARHGCRVLCPPARNAWAGAQSRSRKPRERERWQERAARRAQLAQPEVRALYGQRGTSVEPAFGIIKNTLGFSRFRLRGLAKVRTEWQLVTLAFNCRRLAAHQRRSGQRLN